LLDGVPAAARNDVPADFDAPIVTPSRSDSPRTAEYGHDNVLRTYKHLRGILYHLAGRPKTFGDDRPALPAGTSEPKIKQAMAEALRALAQQPSASSVLNFLVAYALRLVEHGTPETSDPALDTIYDYVVTIGLRLVSVAPRQEFDALSEGDYLEIYDRAAISKTDKQRIRVLTRMAFFHRFLVSHYGVEPVDEGELMPEGSREFSVDANIITPIEYLAARTALIESIGSATGEEARIRFAALITLILMWRGMARISEIVLRRFGDLTADSTGWYLRICPSQFGRLKSFAAKRICALDDRLDDTERAWLQRWVTEQRTWLGDTFTAKLPLLPSRILPTEPMNRAVIAHVLSQALHWATGDPNARPHWLRHGGASLTLLFCSASEAMMVAIPQSQRKLWHARAAEGAAAFRTALAGRPLASYRHLAQLRTLIGHSRITITISHYGHIFPLIDSGIELANLGDVTAAEWANMAALAHDNFRQLRSRHPAGGVSVAGDVARVLQHAQIPRRLPSNAATDAWQPPRIIGARALDLAPDVLARFLMRLADGVAWAPLAQSFGMTQEQQCGLTDALLMLHERAPQAWFRKAELISMAEACSDPALITDARSLIERPYLGLPQRRLEHDMITRVWEPCADRNDRLCSAIYRISEAVAYGAERRQRIIPLSSLNQLVEVTSTLHRRLAHA
jgi:hypothetical protein